MALMTCNTHTKPVALRTTRPKKRGLSVPVLQRAMHHAVLLPKDKNVTKPFGWPPRLCCPIGLTPMVEPVVNELGQTYDKHNYLEALKRNPNIDPMTNTPLANPETMFPNLVIKSEIRELAAAHGVPDEWLDIANTAYSYEMCQTLFHAGVVTPTMVDNMQLLHAYTQNIVLAPLKKDTSIAVQHVQDAEMELEAAQSKLNQARRELLSYGQKRRDAQAKLTDIGRLVKRMVAKLQLP
jgi:hypothetical protein